jgi:hypothetical protein
VHVILPVYLYKAQVHGGVSEQILAILIRIGEMDGIFPSVFHAVTNLSLNFYANKGIKLSKTQKSRATQDKKFRTRRFGKSLWIPSVRRVML